MTKLGNQGPLQAPVQGGLISATSEHRGCPDTSQSTDFGSLNFIQLSSQKEQEDPDFIPTFESF